MKAKLIYSGTRSKVWDNGDGTVSKETTDITEFKLSQELIGIDLKYVANYFNSIAGRPAPIIYKIKKEKIQKWGLLKYEMLHLKEHWDESLLNSHELYEYINEYLKNGTRTFLSYRTPNKFKEYLLTINNKGFSPLFDQLCRIVQELKDHNIYNVDWNYENFGYKNDHLALFELGGAKIR